MDRNYPGAARIARLAARTHVLIRLKRITQILADGSYLAEISGDGVTATVRIIEYDVSVEGQRVPEMFCLVTDLLDIDEYPAPELAGLYKWRWDGSETALREAKASLRGAGPSAGPMRGLSNNGTASGVRELTRTDLPLAPGRTWRARSRWCRGQARRRLPAPGCGAGAAARARPRTHQLPPAAPR